MWVITSYNGLVTSEASVDKQFANVESKLQRRYDLIPNLVNAVKGSMTQEKEVFTAIADARSKLAGAKNTNDKVNASNQIEGALSRLLVITENYPELKSNTQVSELMTELSGTENRISVERDRYNKAVEAYNVKVKKFPTSIMANISGYKDKAYFEAKAEAKEAPKVDFSK